ncbi:MAG: ABC transporter ATP-binding protein, partial [Kribbellaceae bacterium]|nr:ABC transporter ATP-binding protein [Kribbellaceae bacterium]
QLCDRLVVMDGGRIVGEGAPGELIRQHASQEVVELRFAAGSIVDLDGIGDRVERLPDRTLLYCANGEKAVSALHDRGVTPAGVYIRRGSLEDVFLRLTGRQLID